jgi:hypothetical protein
MVLTRQHSYKVQPLYISGNKVPSLLQREHPSIKSQNRFDKPAQKGQPTSQETYKLLACSTQAGTCPECSLGCCNQPSITHFSTCVRVASTVFGHSGQMPPARVSNTRNNVLLQFTHAAHSGCCHARAADSVQCLTVVQCIPGAPKARHLSDPIGGWRNQSNVVCTVTATIPSAC